MIKNYVAPLTLVAVLPIVLYLVLKKTTTISKKVLPNIISFVFVITLAAVGYYSIALSKEKFVGPTNVDGTTPTYADNGLSFWLVTSIIVSFISFISPTFVDLFTENFIPFILTCNILGLLFVIYLYNKDKNDYFDKEEDDKKGHSALFKFYRGLKFHPTIFGVDIKQWTNCRFGMIAWQLIILIFAFYLYHHIGFNWAMFVSVLLQTIYIGKFFHWETGYFNTLDITLDRAGYYICWGCLVFVPAFYTLTTYFLANHPPNISPFFALFVLAMGMLFIYLNYEVDRQKEAFKADNDTDIWGKKAEFLPVKYMKDGKEKDSKLLLSGFWGMSRHMNYVFEILLTLCWCIVGITMGVIPMLYFIFIVILLTHRIFRDEDKCKAKYGEYWDQYCEKVPYRLIPRIF
jgi:7-dehydrocholesterol reductase